MHVYQDILGMVPSCLLFFHYLTFLERPLLGDSWIIRDNNKLLVFLGAGFDSKSPIHLLLEMILSPLEPGSNVSIYNVLVKEILF